MKDRCYNCNHIAYKDYGGRGIIICDEWLNDFDKFYLWAMSNGYRKDLSIDRFPNNDGNYEPPNCRWATKKQQSNNRRNKKGSKLGSRKVNLMDVSDKTGIKYPTLCSRIWRGIVFEEAIDNQKNFKINNPHSSKPICQYDLNGKQIAEYPSIKEATRATSFKKPMLIHHLKGRRKTAYGFIWAYKNNI